MTKKNCWEFKHCGREPGGHSAAGGICPAATESTLEGIHGGRRAGRSCWVVAGTRCNGRVQGTFAMKSSDCMTCDFYLSVKQDEGLHFKPGVVLLNLLNR